MCQKQNKYSGGVRGVNTSRPNLEGKKKGRRGEHRQYIIDSLREPLRQDH